MKYDILKFENMEYVKTYPNDYKEGEKRPVLILLHGWGPLADRKIEGCVNNGFFPITNTVNKYPFIVLSPLCPKDMWFDSFETLERFVKYAFTADFTDSERLYIMGASMGGYATWQLAMSLPELLAAIVPICGGGMYWHAYSLASLPIWAHHGAKDQTIFVEESEKMVDAVNRSGGNAKLTVYPDVEHASWVNVYETPEVFHWLLEQKNKRVEEGYKRIESGI